MNDQLQQLKSRLTAAQSVLLTFPEKQPSQDVIAATLAIYLSLIQSGKAASVVSSSLPLVRDSHLVGLDKITNSVGGNNLVISLDVPENAVDKVTSNTDGGHLNLVISPAKGVAPITEKNVKFSYTGAYADLVIVVGASQLSDIGSLVEKENSLFTLDRLINISNLPGSFGSVNLSDPSCSNSELVTALLNELALPLDIDIANNLMRGIEDATSNLSSTNMTADTFEALAVLYRIGARRNLAKNTTQTAKIVSDMPIIDTVEQPEEDWTKPKIYTGAQKNQTISDL